VAEQRANSYWVILSTFLVAFVLAVLPLPQWLLWARPEWVALVLIYWTIALPHRVGPVTALVAGIMLDVLEGAVLGQNAFSLAVIALLAMAIYRRLRVFGLWQQSVVIFAMVGLNLLLCQWVQTLEGVVVRNRLFLLSALSSALLWPVVLHILRALRRNYQVT
jgi:rod shape-determining protein MreD